jgi:hypothetical protein
MLPLWVYSALVCGVLAATPDQAHTNWQSMNATRPFIVSLSVTTGSTTYVAWSDASGPATSPPPDHESVAGRISAVVSPTNLCDANVSPAHRS